MIVFPGRIPIAIHPLFWLFAALIGWMNGGSLLGMFIWIGIIFFSVLIHEFGHALTALVFKHKANIQLVALGGLTSFEGPKLKFWQQFLITLNGPVFGFMIFVGATLLLKFDWTSWPVVHLILKWTQIANLFWAVVNLLPVMPLDGGQLLRIVLEAFFGIKGFRASLLAGAVIATLISFYFFLVQAFLIGAFFFLFAFQSFDMWRKSRRATLDDREEDNKHLLVQAESALQLGERAQARKLLEEVLSKSSKGLLGIAAAQYLAFLDMKEGRHREAYDLLLPIREEIADESLCLLHQLAAEFKNYPVVAELSADCFQTAPSQEMALRNARAFAFLKQPKHAGGWLQTAWQEGNFDLETVLKEEVFASIKDLPEFREFTDSLN